MLQQRLLGCNMHPEELLPGRKICPDCLLLALIAHQEEGEEDLAALHAEMLKAATSVATGKGGGGKIKAAEGGRDGRQTGRIGVGDRVEGRFEAGTEWFPAVVTKV